MLCTYVSTLPNVTFTHARRWRSNQVSYEMIAVLPVHPGSVSSITLLDEITANIIGMHYRCMHVISIYNFFRNLYKDACTYSAV